MLHKNITKGKFVIIAKLSISIVISSWKASKSFLISPKVNENNTWPLKVSA